MRTIKPNRNGAPFYNACPVLGAFQGRVFLAALHAPEPGQARTGRPSEGLALEPFLVLRNTETRFAANRSGELIYVEQAAVATERDEVEMVLSVAARQSSRHEDTNRGPALEKRQGRGTQVQNLNSLGTSKSSI